VRDGVEVWLAVCVELDVPVEEDEAVPLTVLEGELVQELEGVDSGVGIAETSGRETPAETKSATAGSSKPAAATSLRKPCATTLATRAPLLPVARSLRVDWSSAAASCPPEAAGEMKLTFTPREPSVVRRRRACD